MVSSVNVRSLESCKTYDSSKGRSADDEGALTDTMLLQQHLVRRHLHLRSPDAVRRPVSDCLGVKKACLLVNRVGLKSVIVGRVRTNGTARKTEITALADVAAVSNRVRRDVHERDLRDVIANLTRFRLMNSKVTTLWESTAPLLVDLAG